MAAGRYDIVIEQGTDFALEAVVKQDGTPIDLTGYDSRAHLRPKKGSDTLTQAFTCTMVDIANGRMKMSMANADSKSISPGRYYYDWEIFTSGDALVSRVLEGDAKVSAETTK